MKRSKDIQDRLNSLETLAARINNRAEEVEGGTKDLLRDIELKKQQLTAWEERIQRWRIHNLEISMFMDDVCREINKIKEQCRNIEDGPENR